MIDVKTAVQSVFDYGRDYSDRMPFYDSRLEEIDSDADGDWLITISSAETPFSSSSRLYRKFRVDAVDGHVKKMKRVTLETL